MRRRSFLTAAGLMGLSAVLAGCSPNQPQQVSRSLSFFNDAASWEPGYLRAGKALAARTGWSLDPQTIPNATSYEQVMRSLLETRNPPDLVKWGSGYRTQDLARTGTLATLDGAWKTSVANGWLDDALRREFTYDGHVYGLPLIQGFYVMFYNTALWAELELEPPTTWDEFMGVCETLKRAGVTPIGTTQVNIWPVANWFSMLAAAFDPDWYQAACTGEASFLDAAPRDMMKLWQEMIDRGYHTSSDALSDDFPAMLQQRRIGMQPTPVSWSTQSLELAGLSGDGGYDAFILPSVHGQGLSVVTEVAGLVVPAGSTRLDAAREAMSNWLAPEVQQPWSDFLNGSSANQEVPWSDPVSRRIQKQVRDEQVRVLNRYWENSPPPLVVGTTQDLGGFMASPTDPRGVLESLQRRAETEWSYWREVTS
ncbi:extracellular solute-binding protein [Georgenia sp. TF02-10]|uniref:ABC transporter substrate-binding protein n=1 Tax=Georgenia sp. TF02-10 TaxID=2917725 RepID=UPI001FA77332|nr:extracellular solute-binding protein [Georgenia sp. TF02-10]UNX55550.1 extracellular solute-binding protein [Georgenia sp. TF02-10]